MKKPAFDRANFGIQPVRDAWNTAQAQFADALRWSTVQIVQARTWLESTHCSTSECSKRLLAATASRKST